MLVRRTQDVDGAIVDARRVGRSARVVVSSYPDAAFTEPELRDPAARVAAGLHADVPPQRPPGDAQGRALRPRPQARRRSPARACSPSTPSTWARACRPSTPTPSSPAARRLRLGLEPLRRDPALRRGHVRAGDDDPPLRHHGAGADHVRGERLRRRHAAQPVLALRGQGHPAGRVDARVRRRQREPRHDARSRTAATSCRAARSTASARASGSTPCASWATRATSSPSARPTRSTRSTSATRRDPRVRGELKIPGYSRLPAPGRRRPAARRRPGRRRGHGPTSRGSRSRCSTSPTSRSRRGSSSSSSASASRAPRSSGTTTRSCGGRRRSSRCCPSTARGSPAPPASRSTARAGSRSSGGSAIRVAARLGAVDRARDRRPRPALHGLGPRRAGERARATRGRRLGRVPGPAAGLPAGRRPVAPMPGAIPVAARGASCAASRRSRARPSSAAPCPRGSGGSRRWRRRPIPRAPAPCAVPASACAAAGTCSIGVRRSGSRRARAPPAAASRPARISRALCASVRVPYSAHSGEAFAAPSTSSAGSMRDGGRDHPRVHDRRRHALLGEQRHRRLADADARSAASRRRRARRRG